MFIRRCASIVMAGLCLASVAQPASASGVDPGVVASALGGSWSRDGNWRSWLVFRGAMRPPECAAGRFTQARKGRVTYYSGSRVPKYWRSAWVHILTYSSPADSRRGLRGLRDYLNACPGPVTDGCTGCDPSDSYVRVLKGAGIGRGSFGWWTGSVGNVTDYATSIAFTKHDRLVVVEYGLGLSRYRRLDQSFVVNVPKTKALARSVRRTV
jgi:hypothetical protein